MEKYPITVKLISDVGGELCFDAYYGEDETSPRIAKVKVTLNPTLNYKEFSWNPQFSDCSWFMGEVYKQIVKIINERDMPTTRQIYKALNRTDKENG